MKRFFQVVFLCCLCVMTSPVRAEPFHLMVMGDSLSVGHGLSKKEAFYSRLEQALAEKYDNIRVLNFSRSGETAAGGVRKIQQALAQRPDAVLLELGINDALRDENITAIQENLQKIIDAFRKNHIPVMLIGMQVPFVKPAPYAQQFKKMYADLAAKNNLILYPFFMEGVFRGTGLIAMQMPNDNLLSDHVHPSAKGVGIMVENVLPSVEKFLDSIL